jgi:CheY-like chemotaxis protein
MIVRILRSESMEVTETSEGGETVRRYEEGMGAGRPMDLVLIDLTIPNGMCGLDAMAALRRIDPRVTAIVSSGDTADHAMLYPAAYGFASALPKPYEASELSRVIREALAARPPRP